MGLFSNLFGGRKEYPALDPTSDAMHRIEEVSAEIEKLAEEVGDDLEVVPSEHAAYVFVGKPPKKFGIAWIHDGKVSNFKTLVEEKGISPFKLEPVVEKLRTAYEECQDAPRYAVDLGTHHLTVIPNDQLEHRVHDIIDQIAA